MAVDGEKQMAIDNGYSLSMPATGELEPHSGTSTTASTTIKDWWGSISDSSM
jgi:hypothetical protein